MQLVRQACYRPGRRRGNPRSVVGALAHRNNPWLPLLTCRSWDEKRRLLPELLAFFSRLGYDIVEMVLADQDSWHRYEAAKWLTMRRRLDANPDEELANEVRAKLTSEPERYATYTREYLGWGVFAPMRR